METNRTWFFLSKGTLLIIHMTTGIERQLFSNSSVWPNSDNCLLAIQPDPNLKFQYKSILYGLFTSGLCILTFMALTVVLELDEYCLKCFTYIMEIVHWIYCLFWYTKSKQNCSETSSIHSIFGIFLLFQYFALQFCLFEQWRFILWVASMLHTIHFF